MTAATLDRPADLSQLLDGDACCEVICKRQGPCEQPAAWLVRLNCPTYSTQCEGNICHQHRNLITDGQAACWCGGGTIQIAWERPI